MFLRYRKWLLRLLFIYLLLSLIPLIFEKQIIFQPKSLPDTYSYEFKMEFEESYLEMSDGTQLNTIYFKSQQPHKGLILYFHGNADNLQRWGNYTPDFLDRGFDVIMYDYRGYGKSKGVPGMVIFHQDAMEIYDLIQAKFPSKEFILYGRSLGSSVASNLATKRNCKALILETPFDEIGASIRSRFPFLIRMSSIKNNFSNLESLGKPRTYPVHILHGTKDRLVPLKSALQLKPLLKIEDSFTIIDGAGHKNLSEFELFQETLDTLLGPRL